jgi:hypothetical protein
MFFGYVASLDQSIVCGTVTPDVLFNYRYIISSVAGSALASLALLERYDSTSDTALIVMFCIGSIYWFPAMISAGFIPILDMYD